MRNVVVCVLLLTYINTHLLAEEVSAPVAETNATVQEQPTESKGVTAMDVAGYVATPVFVAGAVVAAIVISPVWLAKKIFGGGKNEYPLNRELS